VIKSQAPLDRTRTLAARKYIGRQRVFFDTKVISQQALGHGTQVCGGS
jgi:hypothetical protein